MCDSIIIAKCSLVIFQFFFNTIKSGEGRMVLAKDIRFPSGYLCGSWEPDSDFATVQLSQEITNIKPIEVGCLL